MAKFGGKGLVVDLSAQEMAWIVGIGVGLYLFARFMRGVDAVGAAMAAPVGAAVDGAVSAWINVTNPTPELTPTARLSQEEYIRLGYGRIDANGVFRITPAGEAYINEQRGKR